MPEPTLIERTYTRAYSLGVLAVAAVTFPYVVAYCLADPDSVALGRGFACAYPNTKRKKDDFMYARLPEVYMTPQMLDMKTRGLDPVVRIYS